MVTAVSYTRHGHKLTFFTLEETPNGARAEYK